jgi:cephalosporin-C deacetylase
VDVKRIGAAGSSQGGGLSLAVAALDPRVAAVSADFPFLCDFRTSLPIALSPFRDIHDLMQREPGRRAAVGRTVPYFDLYYLAPRIKAPVKVQVGLRDRTCPAEGVRNVFERISGPKSLEEWPQADHSDENVLRAETMMDFIYERLGARPAKAKP